MALGLSEPIVDQILNAYDSYQQCIEIYSKPAGKRAFEDNLEAIRSLSKKLSKKLQKLTSFERQMLICPDAPKISDLIQNVSRLHYASDVALKKKIKFSKRRLFLTDLTLELWEVLEQAKIKVTIYKNSILCCILKTLFPEKNNTDDPDLIDSEWAFTLVRDVNNRFKKNLPKDS